MKEPALCGLGTAAAPPRRGFESDFSVTTTTPTAAASMEARATPCARASLAAVGGETADALRLQLRAQAGPKAAEGAAAGEAKVDAAALRPGRRGDRARWGLVRGGALLGLVTGSNGDGEVRAAESKA